MSGRWNRWIAAGLLSALTIAGALLAGVADAGQGPRMRRGVEGHARGAMGLMGQFRGLDLTDAQRDQLRAIAQQHRAEFQSVGERLRSAQRAVQEAVTAPVTDESLIRQRVSERALVEADAAVLRARVHAQSWQVLTPEQQQKAEALKAQRQERLAQRRQRSLERRQQRQQQAAPQPPQ